MDLKSELLATFGQKAGCCYLHNITPQRPTRTGGPAHVPGLTGTEPVVCSTFVYQTTSQDSSVVALWAFSNGFDHRKRATENGRACGCLVRADLYAT
ncbi:hypothetical protein DPEC_G00227340 [Dallia pectoralis]|uniref:Uncharacterized protein n=1 Tax=Dallia pectoralis TaxID=75939 RepID=A0ACC2G1A3_DALPE|nr:hypothetical protein DPEC_G00227340 [Dallia pectoralis]